MPRSMGGLDLVDGLRIGLPGLVLTVTQELVEAGRCLGGGAWWWSSRRPGLAGIGVVKFEKAATRCGSLQSPGTSSLIRVSPVCGGSRSNVKEQRPRVDVVGDQTLHQRFVPHHGWDGPEGLLQHHQRIGGTLGSDG